MPKLSELADGPLHDDVKKGDHKHPHVVAFADYPGGDLSVVETFEHPFKYTLNTKVVTLCVPRVVKLEVTTTGNVTMIITNKTDGNEIELAPDATLTFLNVARKGRHFHHYKDLLASGNLATEKELTTSMCNVATGEIESVRNETNDSGRKAATLDFRVVPRGDCGNTSWP